MTDINLFALRMGVRILIALTGNYVKHITMKIKLLRIIRANFDIYIVDNKFVCHPKGCLVPIHISEFKAFTAIAKMIECIYPCGKFYSIMRHCRLFKCHKLLV